MSTRRAQQPVFDPDLPDLPHDARWREWMGRVEAAIFASPEPVSRERLAHLVGAACHLDDLIADIRAELRHRPYDLVFVAGGWHHRTRASFAGAIDAAPRDGARLLNDSELLALATIAYQQPITRAEIAHMIGREISRDLIARLKRLGLIDAGPRAPTPGAPPAYVTTPQFLSQFNLASLRDLPDIEDIAAMAEAG